MNYTKLKILYAARSAFLLLSRVFAAWLYIAIVLYVTLPVVPYVQANAILTKRHHMCVYLGRSGFIAYGYYNRNCPAVLLINPSRAMKP